MSDIMISCATHLPAVTSWVDNHPLFKIIIPSLITGSAALFIGSLAYGVAYNQREIAANKYKLDLFDKRVDIYEKFLDEFKDFSSPSKDFNYFCDKVAMNENLFLKCSRLFAGESKKFDLIQVYTISIPNLRTELNKIKKEDYDQYVQDGISGLEKRIEGIKEGIVKLKEINDPLDMLGQNEFYLNNMEKIKDNFFEYERKYKHRISEKEKIKNEIAEKKEDLDDIFEQILPIMEKQISLSHNPYEKDKEIYVFSFIFWPIRFCKRLTFKKPSE